jgi:hypothetical protein
MITVTKQTEQEQREMYEKMLKRDVIDMLIESNKQLNRILENTLPIYGVVKSSCDYWQHNPQISSATSCKNCGKEKWEH